MIRILFVCLGNICRSPAAEGMMRHMASTRKHALEIDSAGTGNWHEGRPPDHRMIAAAKTRGIDISPLRARQICHTDYYEFDYILAMDSSNFADLRDLAPDNATANIALFMTYSENKLAIDVPDPYYGSEDGFELVLEMLESACDSFLNQLSTICPSDTDR